MNDLVSTDWLDQHRNQANVAILDASMFLPGSGRDPTVEFRNSHIPGARFFDIEAIADLDHPVGPYQPVIAIAEPAPVGTGGQGQACGKKGGHKQAAPTHSLAFHDWIIWRTNGASGEFGAKAR